jgi:hypothetical protein
MWLVTKLFLGNCDIHKPNFGPTPVTLSKWSTFLSTCYFPAHPSMLRWDIVIGLYFASVVCSILYKVCLHSLKTYPSESVNAF